MKRNPSFLIAAAVIAFSTFMAACHKDTSSSSNSNSVTLITQAPWKYDTAGIDLNKDGIIDVGDTTITACFKDNTYTFNKDSTGVMNEGATKCNVSDPQTVNFTWSITGSNPQVLKSNADTLLESGIGIYSISSTQWKLYKDTTVLGVSFYYILSLKH